MDQKYALLPYLLLLSLIKNSSKVATFRKIASTPSTARLESTTTFQTVLSRRSSAPTTPSFVTLCLLTMGSCFGSLLTKDPTSASASAACLWRQATDEQEVELMEDEGTEHGKKEKFIFRIIKFKRRQKHKQFLEKFWENQDTNYTQLSTRNGNDSISDIQLQNLDVNMLLNSSTLAKESVISTTASAAPHVYSRTSSSLDLEWEHEYVAHIRPYTATLPTTSAMAAATTSTSSFIQRHPPELSDSWQFLSQRQYFDDDQCNSLVSLPSSSSCAPVPETAQETSEHLAHEQEQISRRLKGAPSQVKSSQRAMQQQQQSAALRQIASYTRTSSRTSCSHISTPESLEWDIDEEQQRQLHVEDDNLGLETLALLHQIEQLKNKVLNETGDGLFDGRGDVDIGDGLLHGNAEYREEINIS